MTKLCAFAADSHVRRNTFARCPGAVGDTLHSLAQVVGWCIKNKANLLLGGDTLNVVRPDSQDVRGVLGLLSKYHDARKWTCAKPSAGVNGDGAPITPRS